MKGVAQATNCTIYNATYEVGVTLDGSVSRIQVWSVFPNSTLGDVTFMSFYSHAALDWLEGAVFAGPNGYYNASEDGYIQVQDNAFFRDNAGREPHMER